jgi:pSer/pThr/pTyr-binding forkhead associated (FHA) protein
MAKLVVVMPDGTTIDVPLSRERITIGRRPDNDLCLPYPAVSGEHAAVVTILADSFLEDLGSTNGTLVNGKPIAKHFLRDRDQIDIGKQKLVFVANDAERYEPPPAALGPLNMRMLSERVERAPAPVVSDPAQRHPRPSKEMEALSDDLEKGISGMQVSAEIDSMAELEAQPVQSMPPLGVVGGRTPPAARSREASPPTPADPDLTQSVTPVAWIKVLTGPSAGRSLPLVKEETTIGRVGIAVAKVRKSADGFVLVPVESSMPALVNGRPVDAGGAPLRAGDEIEIAGTKLALALQAKP